MATYLEGEGGGQWGLGLGGGGGADEGGKVPDCRG